MSADNPHLDHLCKPDRFVEVANLHQKAFAWEPQGRIPLGIHVANPEYAKDLDYSEWLNPEPYLEFQTKMLADTLTVGADLLPAVAINHLGDVVIPRMFGAELLMPKSGSETYQEAGATLQDVGPTPYPVLSDIQEVAELGMPPLDAGQVYLPEVWLIP